MAYLGNGIYDLIDVVKASANPQINYEGLYQDQMPDVITFNPFKAMTPGYTFSDLLPRYFDKNPDMASPSGKFYDDLKLRGDFKRVNQGLPLFNRYGDPDRVGRFEGFSPRVGTITPYTPPNLSGTDDQASFFFPTNVQKGIMTQTPLQNLGFDTSLGVANEEDVEQVDYLGSKPNKVQTGIAKLLEFLQRFSPIANISRGIESIRNRFDTRKAIRDDIIRDRQGTINTIISPRIMNIQPTAQDIARGGGSIPTRTTSRRTSPQGGMQAERTRSRDLGRMRGGVGR